MIRVVLVGIGGYARIYTQQFLQRHSPLYMQLVGCVDPYAHSSQVCDDIYSFGIPVYDTLEEFYRQHVAELAVIATPIHLHTQQVLFCLRHGSHVLCEKPLCATIDDAVQIARERSAAHRLVSVGYQWCYSDAIQRMKADVISGIYGRALRMRTIVLWPRPVTYYTRSSGWAGHRKAKDGAWILDSIASNAAAHYLQNMLYAAGGRMEESAQVEMLEAEVYRANSIEMFDTCAMRAQTTQGLELLFLASHAVAPEKERNPEFIFEFENGTIFGKELNGRYHVWGECTDGRQVQYGDPGREPLRKLSWTIEAIQTGKQEICGPEAVWEQTRCVNRMAELFPVVPAFSAADVQMDANEQVYYVPGLDMVLGHCFIEDKLPSELDPCRFSNVRRGSMVHYWHFQG